MDRRDILQVGGALAAATLFDGAASPALAAGLADAVLVDTRFPESLAAARRWPASRLLSSDGDLTELWRDQLDGAWRGHGGRLLGLTGEDVLFVLETLARDRRRRVLQRMALPSASGAPLVAWTIAVRA